MTYQDIEKKFIDKTYIWREKYLAGFLEYLTKLRITANHITNFRGILFLWVIYEIFVKESLLAATIVYLLIFWLLDALDGALARYQKTSSDRGKFIDMILDQTCHSIYIMGLAFLSIADPFILFFHVIISGSLYLLSSVLKNENKASDWLIHADPHLIYIKLISNAFVLIYILFGVNLLDTSYLILNVIMTVTFIKYFSQFQKNTYTKK